MPKTYCTYRITIANHERVQVEKWNSLHQPLGDPSGAFRYLEKLNELAPLLTRASNNELNSSNEVKCLGEILFDILFDDGLCRDFVGFYQQVVHQNRQLLRIELVIDEQRMPEVAALPWEFMCLPERANLGTIWLSTAPEVVFSRRRAQYFAAQPIQLQKGEKLRIALIVASPPNLPAVSHQPIQEALEKLAQEKTDLVELLPVLKNADPGSIDEVLTQSPHIVHFIGYCGLPDDQEQEVGVFLVDPDLKQAMWVEADYFSELLNRHRPGLVILQAGKSGTLSVSQSFAGVASRVLQQNIPVIVAMHYEVSDTISSQFPRRFYKQLAEGDPVDIAAQYGRRAISLSPKALYKKRDFATPVIYMRIEDGYLFETYQEDPPQPSSSVELRRRLEAAMPKQCQVEQPTEVRVMVALHDSPGLRATLPDYTESGDLIEKNDVVQNDVPLEFPVDSKTQKPLSVSVFVSLTAPGFKVEISSKSIRVSPEYDSGIVTFFLTPNIIQKRSRVIVEWFGDEQKNTLLGSLTLITEVVESQDSLSKVSWEMKDFQWDFDISGIIKAEEERAKEASTAQSTRGENRLLGLRRQLDELIKKYELIEREKILLVSGEMKLVLNESKERLLDQIVDVQDSLSWFEDQTERPLSSPPLRFPALNTFEFQMVACVDNDFASSSESETKIIIRYARQSSQYYIEDLRNGIEILMLFTPAGAFIMGSPEDEMERSSSESPQHEVRVISFFMSRYPVTQAQWRCVTALPQVNRELNPNPSMFKGDNRPVENVSWYDAVEFCYRLSLFTGRNYGLPTETEWEYACRAGTTTPFHCPSTLVETTHFSGRL
jgi:formylglycine-generating enzyme required for sulfatase activity